MNVVPEKSAPGKKKQPNLPGFEDDDGSLPGAVPRAAAPEPVPGPNPAEPPAAHPPTPTAPRGLMEGEVTVIQTPHGPSIGVVLKPAEPEPITLGILASTADANTSGRSIFAAADQEALQTAARMPAILETERVKAAVTGVGTQRFPNKDKVNDFTAELAKSDSAARKALDTRLGGNVPGGDGKSAHHINPWEFKDHSVVQAAARGGWNMNGMENGVLLPTEPVHPQGFKHPQYNAEMGQILDELATIPLTDAQAARVLTKLGDVYGTLLKNLTTRIQGLPGQR
jgi:hypothetical protein